MQTRARNIETIDMPFLHPPSCLQQQFQLFSFVTIKLSWHWFIFLSCFTTYFFFYLLCVALLWCRILIKIYVLSSFRSCSSSQTSWHFWSSITSSSPSHSTLLWRCRSSWAPFSLAGIWTFTTRRATRKLRSTPLTSMRSSGRYGLEVQEHIHTVHTVHTYSETHNCIKDMNLSCT